ncbi:MAG TPA: hypothetical protein VNZ22_21490, partial [Bacillota bacterium]|nr:hypothetical protein [Bacillota bacterium]
IAILAAMLLPSLGRAKSKAQGVKCMNNGKQLQLAWNMYTQDNEDKVAPVDDTGTSNPADWGKYWCAGNMASTTPTDRTNVLILMNGLLYKYTPNLGIYKCPADPATMNWPTKTGPPRCRSISASQVFSKGYWLPTPPYRTFQKLSTVVKPTDTWVFIDEQPDSINDGGFGLRMAKDSDTTGTIIDYPAGYHGGACGMSFADGHSVIHRWKSSRMFTPPNPVGNYTGGDVAADMKWFSSVTTVMQ